MFSSAVVKSAKVAQLLHFVLPWGDVYLIGIGLSWDNVGLATLGQAGMYHTKMMGSI